MTAPVLYIIFNRLDTVQKSFVPIKYARPEKLYIAADGPRVGKAGESEKCQQVRDWVLSQIDWECDVKTLFRDKNLGCGQGPKQAIDWLFENEEMGIILEDDCVASDSFFEYATQMLERYKEDKSISIVCGSNFDSSHLCISNEADYFFSVVPYTWGWATWKRNWLGYDYKMSDWSLCNKDRLLHFISHDVEHRNYWRYVFDQTANAQPHDIWDYQFFYLCYSRRQMAVVPNRNLIINIGCDDDATHLSGNAEHCYLDRYYSFPMDITHPNIKIRNKPYDTFVLDHCYGRVPSIPWFTKFKRWLRRCVKRF